MPFPTIHLLVTEKVMQKLDKNISGKLMLGSLSPDAIHARNGIAREDKHRTHLRVPDFNSAWDNSIALIQRSQKDPFILGYALHIMTDYLWIHDIWTKFKKALPEDMPMEEVKLIYNQEMDYIDRWFYRTPAVRKLWKIATNATAQSVPGVLTANEIKSWANQRLGFIVTEFDEATFGVVKIERVIDFIEDASTKLAEELKKLGY